MSAAVQFLGTLIFSVMTLRALAPSMDTSRRDYAQLRNPDVVGSLLFLVSDRLASDRPRARRHLLHVRSRLICWWNMVGSVLFGMSEIGAQMLPDGSLDNEVEHLGGRSRAR